MANWQIRQETRKHGTMNRSTQVILPWIIYIPGFPKQANFIIHLLQIAAIFKVAFLHSLYLGLQFTTLFNIVGFFGIVNPPFPVQTFVMQPLGDKWLIITIRCHILGDNEGQIQQSILAKDLGIWKRLWGAKQVVPKYKNNTFEKYLVHPLPTFMYTCPLGTQSVNRE